MKFSFFILSFFICGIMFSQITKPNPTSNKKPEKVTLVNADLEEINENVFEGNMVYSGSVIAEHETSRLMADSVIYFQDKEFIEARGNIKFTDKQTVLVCDRLTYDVKKRLAIAYDKVKLSTPDQIVETEELIYDVNSEVAYFDNWGTVYRDNNSTRSKVGRYYAKENRIELGESSTLESPEYQVLGSDIKYNTQTGIAEFSQYTRINNKKDHTVYVIGSKGTYNTHTKESFLKKDGRVYYQGKILTGDDLYFNETTGFGKGIKNVKVDDPKENRYLMGDYGEVYQFKDSAMVTGRPYMVKAFTKDSLYMYSDTLIAIQNKDKKSEIRGYYNGRIFKSNMSGKSDSLVYRESIGKIDFYKKPIFWSSGGRQLISDTLSVYMDTKTQDIDSIYARENAFIISKVDSLSQKMEFNQARGRKLYAYFENNDIYLIDLQGNAEAITYVEEENTKTKEKERTGISRSICGILQAEFLNREMEVVSCKINAETDIYPESKLPIPERFLSGFDWREKERLTKWEDIFPNDISEGSVESKEDTKQVPHKIVKEQDKESKEVNVSKPVLEK